MDASFRPLLRLSLFVLLLAAAITHAPAQTMPLEITTRLWDQPGPQQDAPDAPKLLVVYPERGIDPLDGAMTRYAGRVSPEDARVTLNGEALKVWPGGVFTGVQSIGAARTATWRFEATRDGKKTTVVRELTRSPAPPPTPPWPPAFAGSPVSPSGDFLLRAGESLPVTLYASPGMKAEFRVGETGAWTPMAGGTPAGGRGAVYRATWIAGESAGEPRAQAVSFRITGEREGATLSRTLQSRLRLASIAPEAHFLGVVTQNVATLFKDATSFDRWGNWPRGTSFPIVEQRDDRLLTSFGHGESGWIETENVKAEWKPATYAAPKLTAPRIELTSRSLVLDWGSETRPIAMLFNYVTTDGGQRLVASLQGAGSLEPFGKTFAPTSRIRSVRGVDGDGIQAPRITIELAEPIWGVGLAGDDKQGLRLEVRVKPLPARTSSARPLAGLRIMIDPGHGGRDAGSIGPSGICEADLNLVQAAWLERDLAAMGAEVTQMRRSDEFVDLDARVDRALAWDPDLFISLHHNSVAFSSDPLSDHGSKVFYHYVYAQPVAQTLATAIQPVLTADSGAETLPQVFRVNRNVSLCPSVLIESGFVCNPIDEFKLRQTETIKTMAASIAAGVKTIFAGQP